MQQMSVWQYFRRYEHVCIISLHVGNKVDNCTQSGNIKSAVSS